MQKLLEACGFRTKRWITNARVDGSKLSTRIRTTWAYKGNVPHDVINVIIKWTDNQVGDHMMEYRRVEGTRENWKWNVYIPRSLSLTS